MSTRSHAIAILTALSLPLFAVEARHGTLVGVVQKIDSAAKTVVVKAADGTEHTLHFVKRTAVHGAQDAAAASKDAFRGLKEGSEVAVHYTAKGTEETADEFDAIGKNGLKAAEATVTHVDRGAKTVTVKTAEGAEESYRLTDEAAKDAGKDLAEAGKKGGKVTVYYTEEAGHKIAHFFKRAI
jgi:hypothetical protein